jgi:hypothetical protein
MVLKQTKAGRLQVAKNKKKVQDALHDTDVTDDEVESPGLNNKEPDPPKEPPSTREVAPDRPDEDTDTEKENKEKDDDNDPPVSDRDPVTNVGTSTDVGYGVAIGDNLPFAIGNTTADERVDTDSVLNVGDIVNPHINDGDELTVPNEGTDDELGSNKAIPRKKPSIPMVPEPQVPKQSTRKL